MRICRYTLPDVPALQPRLGVMDEEGIRDVTAAAQTLAPQRWPLPPGDQLIGSLGSLREHMEELARAAPVIARSAVRLLSPVANPGKFICGVGNWSHHKARVFVQSHERPGRRGRGCAVALAGSDYAA